MKKHAPGMRITQGKGFQMTFANGFTASVQFGWQNYCENRNVNRQGFNPHTYESDPATECENAEVAFWYDGGELRSLPEWSDTVRGWLSADEVLEFLNTVADMREDEETIPTENEVRAWGKDHDLEVIERSSGWWVVGGFYYTNPEGPFDSAEEALERMEEIITTDEEDTDE